MMALIPPDVGIQLRAQTDAQLQPVAPARPIPVDLPELQVGQYFSARIQEALPDNIYKALVAGKAITLHLPEGAKAGDLLELVLVDRTPRLLIAQQVPQPAVADGASQTYPHTTLSRAANLIGGLLPQEGETPAPVQLNRGEPLLSRPPISAQEILSALKTAITQSGMFYESHQAQWVAGKLPLANLLQEPQGQLSHPTLLAAQRIANEALRLGSPASAAESIQPAVIRSQVGIRSGEEGRTTASDNSSAPATMPAVAGELRPLVQQQLEGSAAQRLVWQGEAWPGQMMNWQLQWDGEQVKEDGRRGSGDNSDNERWRTTLTLTTPQLGRVEATLRLEDGGVRIAIAAPGTTGAAALRDAAPDLATALDTAGVPLLGIQIQHGGE